MKNKSTSSWNSRGVCCPCDRGGGAEAYAPVAGMWKGPCPQQEPPGEGRGGRRPLQLQQGLQTQAVPHQDQPDPNERDGTEALELCYQPQPISFTLTSFYLLHFLSFSYLLSTIHCYSLLIFSTSPSTSSIYLLYHNLIPSQHPWSLLSADPGMLNELFINRFCPI